MRTLALTLSLSLAPCLAGCATNTAPTEEFHEDTPSSYAKAQYLEEQAIKNERAANDTADTGKRREKLGLAMDQLRDARLLYENELIAGEGTPELQRNLEREISRLDARIDQLRLDRPVE